MFWGLQYTIFCIRIDSRRLWRTADNIYAAADYGEGEERRMKIIKRNGSEEIFDIKKIVIAITKADTSTESRSLTDSQIEDIAEYVEFKCNKLNRAVSVEEIQDMVENQIMATGAFDLARRYGEGSIAFRSNRYFIWNFLPEKSYIMQCYAIVSEEVSSCE